MVSITMKSLLEAGVHFGHQTRRWNPKMGKFIFTERSKVHIIDLQKTIKELKKAYKFVRDGIAEGKSILFVGTKKQLQETVLAEAKRCGAFYVSERWLGGTLTNFKTIRQSVKRLKELEKMKEEGIFKLLSRKENSRREKEMMRLDKFLVGIKDMETLPEMLFVVDPVEEMVAVKEAKKVNIAVISVCDTDADPDLIDYPIPGNDDAIRAVKLFCSIIADAVTEGKSMIVPTTEEAPSPEIPAPETGVSKEELDEEIKLGEDKLPEEKGTQDKPPRS